MLWTFGNSRDIFHLVNSFTGGDIMTQKVLEWVSNTDKNVLKRMFKKKLDLNYVRPSHLDIFAQQVIVASQRPTCLFYEVGALIFCNGSHFLSSGYNGPVSGDVDPREAGCARVVGKRKNSRREGYVSWFSCGTECDEQPHGKYAGA